MGVNKGICQCPMGSGWTQHYLTSLNIGTNLTSPSRLFIVYSQLTQIPRNMPKCPTENFFRWVMTLFRWVATASRHVQRMHKIEFTRRTILHSFESPQFTLQSTTVTRSSGCCNFRKNLGRVGPPENWHYLRFTTGSMCACNFGLKHKEMQVNRLKHTLT